MAWVAAKMGSAFLATASALGAGCSWSPDLGAARFACDSLTPCPDGQTCRDGYCEQPGAADASDLDPLMDGGPDGAVGQNTPLEWQDVSVATEDNLTIETITTPDALSGDAGDLYLAFISTKPPRAIQSVGGLGLAWTQLRQQCTGRSTAALAMFWAPSPQADSGKVTATMTLDTDGGSAVLSVHRYAGADLSGPIGTVSWANTNGHDDDVACDGGVDTDSYSWSSLDTGAPGSVVVSGAHTANYPSHMPGDDYTERSDDQSGATSTSAGVAVQDRRLADPATDVRVSGRWENAPDWAVIAVELRD